MVYVGEQIQQGNSGSSTPSAGICFSNFKAVRRVMPMDFDHSRKLFRCSCAISSPGKGLTTVLRQGEPSEFDCQQRRIPALAWSTFVGPCPHLIRSACSKTESQPRA